MSRASTPPRTLSATPTTNTTLAIYGHFDESDLEGAMETYADWITAQEGAE